MAEPSSSSSQSLPCRDTSSFAFIDLPTNECEQHFKPDRIAFTVQHVQGTEKSNSKQQCSSCKNSDSRIAKHSKLKGEGESFTSQCPNVVDAFQKRSLCAHSLVDENKMPPELHAICLLALFHVHFVCGICNEALIDCICLECGHNFCAHCLQQWLVFNRVCPTCYQHVKEDFGGQRTYCVDEFVAEMYTSVQELTQEYFGNTLKAETPNSPELHQTSSEIQASIRNTRILNPTPPLYRQHLKTLRRNFMQEKNPTSERNDFSLLEQQTELFGGPDSLTLSTVVQFFLSSITAYITYEGGDGIDNDVILVGAVSVLVWGTAFLTLMRLLGYDGSFSDLMSYLTFVQLVETANPVDAGQEENLTLSSEDSEVYNVASSLSPNSSDNNQSSLVAGRSYHSNTTGSSIEFLSSAPAPGIRPNWNCTGCGRPHSEFLLPHPNPSDSRRQLFQPDIH